MRSSWNEDRTVWMDLAFNTQAEAARGNATSYNTKYSDKMIGNAVPPKFSLVLAKALNEIISKYGLGCT